MKSKKILSMLAVICLVLFGGIFLTACGGGNSLTINFESNGGTSCSSVEYTQDRTLTMPNNPTREDYLFGGWYEDNGTFEKEFNLANINTYLENDSLTLYAKWLKKVNLVFISDDNFGDIYLDSLDIELPTPTKDGYTFDCWCIDQELTKPYTTETVVEANNYNEVYLYPRWTSVKMVYYYNTIDATFDKTRDTISVGERITLYQPNIQFYQFDGWFYDSAYTQPVPNRISNDMLKNEVTVLYGKFTFKEIDSLTSIGKIKTEYEYGEEFDVGTAKLLVHYVDEQFEDEVIDITNDMVEGFYSQDNGYSSSTRYEQEKDYDRAFYGTVYFCVFDHTGTQIAKTSSGIYYKVKSDIETFALNKDLVFEFGEDESIANKGVVISWTSKQGEMSESLSDGTNKNYRSNLSTGKIGTYTFSLRFHYRTIEFEYTVNEANITSGYVEKSSSSAPILLNNETSLMEQDIYLHNADAGENILYTGLTENDIIEDIDTSIAGEQFAKINVNGYEVNIRYYVVDLENVKSVTIPTVYYQDGYIGGLIGSYIDERTFTAVFTMEDGETFEHHFSPLYITIGQPDFYVITGIDTTTAGTKYAKVYYYGYEFDVEYTVKGGIHTGIINGDISINN